MSAEIDLRRLFEDCVQGDGHCVGVGCDPKNGVIPRGFGLGPGPIEYKRLAVVFKEPGSISATLEGLGSRPRREAERKRYLAALSTGGWKAVAREAEAVLVEYFTLERTPMHAATMGLLRELFGVVDSTHSNIEVMQRCYFSELTKCEKARGSIPPRTRGDCVRAYLVPELKIVRPRAILLFTEDRSLNALAEELSAIAPVIRAHHPSQGCTWCRRGSPRRKNLVEELRRLLR